MKMTVPNWDTAVSGCTGWGWLVNKPCNDKHLVRFLIPFLKTEIAILCRLFTLTCTWWSKPLLVKLLPRLPSKLPFNPNSNTSTKTLTDYLLRSSLPLGFQGKRGTAVVPQWIWQFRVEWLIYSSKCILAHKMLVFNIFGLNGNEYIYFWHG